ncbi:MAG: glycosyltransferase family 2 protein [Patescibacteria group bacterium]
MKKAIIIIPTYNEAKTIEKTLFAVDEVVQKIKDWQMSVLIVDDSSPDGTGKVVSEMGKKMSYVHLLTNPKKSGLGGAYLKGMAEAFGPMKADVVFEFDADLSHDPKKIPELLKKIDQGYDMVLGSRYIPGGSIPENWGLHRKLLSMGANILIPLILTDFSIRDWSAGYRAITKKVYDAVKDEMTSDSFAGYTFQIGFLHKAKRKGFKVAEVPIHFVDREEGESKLGAEYIKNTLLYLIRVRIKEIVHHRIFKFVIVGGVGAVIQLGTLQLFRMFFAYQLSYFFSVELAVLSNFILSNLWTFSDNAISAARIPFKFVQFNLASLGSILIQQILAFLVQNFLGLFVLFTVPIIGLPIDTGLFFAVVGILLGMFWNFFAYSKIVWKKK